LEEPPENLILILITNDLRSLLDTIRSRCQPIHFPRFSDQQIQEIVMRFETVQEDLIPTIRVAQNDLKRVFQLLQEDLEQRRKSIYNFLRAVASSNYQQVFEIIDDITSTRNKNQVLEFLEILVLWLRDALHANILEQEAEYINLDYTEAIQKFAKLYKNLNYDDLISAVERTRNNIEHNAHSGLALAALATEMKNQLTNHAQAMEVKAS
jgi:DNA polymerase-3 subunit delta'